MKKKSLIVASILPMMMLTACGNPGTSQPGGSTPPAANYVVNITENDLAPFKSSPVNIKFWNPINGPDSGYLQNLIKYWNDKYGSYIYIDNDSLSEGDHYTRLFTSFANNSTADLTLIHSSRVPTFQKADRLRPMTNMLAKVGIEENQYVSSIWNASKFDNDMYALAWDIIPTVFYYNRKLIPTGYTEAMIQDDTFTMDQMLEMMIAGYKHSPIKNKKTYGMAFNFAFTENPFISFLYQLGGKPVDVNNPKEPLFAGSEGVGAANAIISIPGAKNESGQAVSSESGSNHLNIFGQGRALFTIDGLWSTESLVLKNNTVDTGIALLPRANATAERTTFGDSHVFTTFKNNNNTAHKDDAMGLIIKFLTDNSVEWCKGGKVAVRPVDASNSEYQALPWAFISQKLDRINTPEKIYTFNTITTPLGECISELCEKVANGETVDVQAALTACANEAREAANNI